MSDFQLHALLRGVIIPAVVAGLVYILARLTPTIMRDTVRAAGLGAAVLMSYLLLIGMPEWPWTGSPKGVVFALVIGSLWLLNENFGSRQLWLRRFFISGLISYLCLTPLLATWNFYNSAQVILLLASLATTAWFIVDRGGQQMQPTAVLVSLMVAAATSAAYMGLTGSASLAQVTGGLAAGLGAVSALSIFKALKAQREFNAVAILALLALWCCHAFYVDTNWKDLLWFLGPLVWFIVRDILGWSGDTPVKDAVVTGLVTLLPAGYGLWLIYQQSISPALG